MNSESHRDILVGNGSLALSRVDRVLRAPCLREWNRFLPNRQSAGSSLAAMGKKMATVSHLDAVGERILDKLARRVGPGRFERYFGAAARLEFRDEALAIHVSTPFYADWLRGRFGDCLSTVAREETGRDDLRIEWSGGESEPALMPAVGILESTESSTSTRSTEEHIATSAASQTAHHLPVPRADRVSLRHRIDDFIVGPSNRLIVDAAFRLSDPYDPPGFSLLFVHGPCGVGKTHLLQGLANRYLGYDRTARVAYYTGEQFTNEYISAVRSGRIESFRKKLRRLELLCVDDVHFLSGKRATQSECLYTLDALELSGARIVLASDAHPRTIEQLSDRLISRCLSGLVVEMPLPDRATRLQLVAQLSTRRGLRLDRECISLVESHAGPSARDIEGALTRIDAFSRLQSNHSLQPTIDVSVVRLAMARLPGPDELARPVSIHAVIDTTCEVVGVSKSDILGKGRHRGLVLARGLVVRIARELTTMSYPEIARSLGRANHSTVVTADQRILRQIERGETCLGVPGHEYRTIGEMRDLTKRQIVSSASRT